MWVYVEFFNYVVYEGFGFVVQVIFFFEFVFKDECIFFIILDVVISLFIVLKGIICKEVSVYLVECWG